MLRILSVLLLCTMCAEQVSSQIPAEVKFKSWYVNPISPPTDFKSVMLWGIAIADTHEPNFEQAQVEIAHVQLTCLVDNRDVVLNDDWGSIRGGLYRRFPWFGTDAHAPMPVAHSQHGRVVILPVGIKPDKVWHFWAASPRAEIPLGRLAGCTVRVRAKISSGALLQVGFDYWRNRTVEYGAGGNNHEAGASDWYLPSNEWQDTVFSDLGREQSRR